MINFYKPDYALDPNSPFARDSENKLLRKSYWDALQDSSVISLVFKWNWCKFNK